MSRLGESRPLFDWAAARYGNARSVACPRAMSGSRRRTARVGTERHVDLYDEAAIGGIPGEDPAATGGDRPLCDRQAESRAVICRRASAVHWLHATERQKDFRKPRFRHARPQVANANDGAL